MLLNPLVIVAALFALLLVGVLLTWAGLRTGRRGTTPYCKVCGYNMTGNNDGRCPECGSLRGVVLGECAIHKPRLAFGAILLLVAASGLGAVGYALLTNFNWYPYAPVSVLAYAYQHADAASATRIGRDLYRRQRAGKLSMANASPLVDLIINDAKRSHLVAAQLGTVVALLRDLDTAGQLTGADRARLMSFFTETLTPQLELRDKIVRGDPIPAKLVFHPDFDSLSSLWIPRFEIESIVVAGIAMDLAAVARVNQIIGPIRPLAADASKPFLMGPLDEAGTHSVRVDLVVRFFKLEIAGGSGSVAEAPFSTTRRSLTASARIVDADYADLVKPHRSPALDAEMRSCVDLSNCKLTAVAHTLGRGVLNGTLNISGSIPTNLAMEGMVVVDGQEDVFGTFAISSSEGHVPPYVMDWNLVPKRNWYISGMTGAPPAFSTRFELNLELQTDNPNRIDIILRTNPEPAKWTVDVVDIWDGEIRFEDVLNNYAK